LEHDVEAQDKVNKWVVMKVQYPEHQDA